MELPKMCRLQIFGNVNKKLKLHSRRNNEQIKLKNSCYHSAENCFSSRVPKISKIKICNYKCTCFLYECETWSHTLMEQHYLHLRKGK
jgi:hypothetical protein